MLNHETSLIEKRIDRKNKKNVKFFCFANTVATIDFAKKYNGHGWVGIRFQIDPKEKYNDIILHVDSRK